MLLIALAVLDSGVAAISCAGATGLAALFLRGRYRGDLAAARVQIPSHRERLDVIVADDVRAAVATGLVAGGLLLGFGIHRPDAWLPPITPLILAIVAATVLISSLADWYVILPRLSGLLGVRPCRDPDIDHVRFPRTWRETTRWWYIHRIVAALVLRFGLSYALARAVTHHVSLPGGASVVAASVTTLFASYLWASGAGVLEAGHLTLILGRTVRRHLVERRPRTLTVFGRPMQIPLVSRRVLGPLGPREYIYDVALESVQLVPVAARERGQPHDRDGNLVYERNPAKLRVRDISASQPVPARPFRGCAEHCSGINWYCIENPQCFATK